MKIMVIVYTYIAKASSSSKKILRDPVYVPVLTAEHQNRSKKMAPALKNSVLHSVRQEKELNSPKLCIMWVTRARARWGGGAGWTTSLAVAVCRDRGSGRSPYLLSFAVKTQKGLKKHFTESVHVSQPLSLCGHTQCHRFPLSFQRTHVCKYSPPFSFNATSSMFYTLLCTLLFFHLIYLEDNFTSV